MELENNLISGFLPKDKVRVDKVLQKLLPHLNVNEISVVGGLAIRYHLNQHSIQYPIRDFNDLDLKAFTPGAVKVSVNEDFLLYHYHPLKNNSFYIVLVDPETKIKIDIFDSTFGQEKNIQVPFHSWNLNVISVEDQLVKTVFDIQRISEDKKVDPKQFSDARLLFSIADLDKANGIWQDRSYLEYPKSITLAIERAETIAKIHPDWVRKNPFKKIKPYKCVDCHDVQGFNIVPMETIYKLLGYIE